MRHLMKIVTFLCVLNLGIACGFAATAEKLADDQTFIFGMPVPDMATLDTVAALTTGNLPITNAIFGALVRTPIGDALNPKGPEPDLATQWEVSGDKLTWTFTLRKGVKWHWGYGECTAEDVVFSLKRVRDSKVSAFRNFYKNFKEISALDKYTVQIKTSAPEPYLLMKVSNSFGGWIVCKNVLEKADKFDKFMSPIRDEIIGTGRFKFSEYVSKDRTVLVRNDDYWEGKPIIERIIYKYIPDENAAELAFLKGEVHMIQARQDKKWIDYIKSKGGVIETIGPTDLKALYLNQKFPPLDNKKVRQAMAYSVSQKSIVAMLGEEISNPGSSPVPSCFSEHIDAGWEKYDRNIQKAKQLLTEAGYPNGVTIKTYMSKALWYLPKMIVFQNEMKETGINLDMEVVDHNLYLKKCFDDMNPIVIYGKNFPVPVYWLREFYHSDSILGSPKAMANFMHYANSEVNKLIEVAETSFDSKERAAALAKAQRLIVDDLPSIPVVEGKIPMVVQNWVDLGYKMKDNFAYLLEIGLGTRILKH